MDAMRLLGFILIVLAGGAMLALALELLNSERHPRRAERTRRVDADLAMQSVAGLPAFFAKPHVNDPLPPSAGFDDALLALLEQHVKTEQALVTNFVRYPSVDSLYRQARPSVTMH